MLDTIYRSRWAQCDDCETVVIVERDTPEGVPEYEDWDGFISCPLCGSSLPGRFGDADELTQREAALRQAERRMPRFAAAALRDAASDLESRAHEPFMRYVGSPGWLRDRATKIEEAAQ